MATFAAVLVNYNSGPELRRALESIEREAGSSWEGVVVDNASTDGSERAALEFGSVRLLLNHENVGFGRGINQAISACTAGRVLVMNPDCQLGAGSLAPLAAVLDADPRCAVAAPRILDPDGTPQGNARGDPDMFTGLFGRASTLRRALPGLEVSRRNVITGPASEESVTVDWVSGACLLARREALAAVGGFDERYFMYWEDADLCRRLRRRGFTVRLVPAASAVHRVGQSSRSARASSIRAFHDSAYLYYATHVAPGTLNPRRWIARGLLTVRCWWKLRSSR
jgi:N-acetylglucosaminyl-diphospho-decaprenol L-rhamnosyltransferase